MQGLADAAEKRGARIFEGTSALTITEDQNGWTVRTAEGVVHAAKLIQATNAYGCDASSDNSIVPASYFQMATAPLPITLRRDILATGEGCWDTALIMSSFRLDHAGRMIFGALGNLDGLGGPLHRQWAKRKLARLFPQLANRCL